MKIVQGERTYIQKKDLLLFKLIDDLMKSTNKELYERICQIAYDEKDPSSFYQFDEKSSADYFDSFQTKIFDFHKIRTESEEELDKEIDSLQAEKKSDKRTKMVLLIDNAIEDLTTIKRFKKTGKGLELPQEVQKQLQKEKEMQEQQSIKTPSIRKTIFGLFGKSDKKTTRQ